MKWPFWTFVLLLCLVKNRLKNRETKIVVGVHFQACQKQFLGGCHALRVPDPNLRLRSSKLWFWVRDPKCLTGPPPLDLGHPPIFLDSPVPLKMNTHYIFLFLRVPDDF